MFTFSFKARISSSVVSCSCGWVALATSPSLVFAQSNPEPVPMLESVVVTGTRDPSDTALKPFAILTNTDMQAKNAGSVGEALQDTPGLSATGFGPNASRPIVRGQDGDRIKILRNSAATVDASALSFDHALPVNPYALTQIEVLRGPAALAYGGNAVGGAVNLVDNRIPRQAVEGVQGEWNTQLFGAADENTFGGQIQAGLGRGLSISIDTLKRHTQDLKTPIFTDPAGNTGRRVQNSASRTDSVGLGASLQTGQGYVGVSTEQYEANYGVPKSLDVRIDMRNQRNALEGEQHHWGWFENVKYRLAETRYQHQEFEDGTPATLFNNQGNDGRIELTLAPQQQGKLTLRNTLGVQFERTRFSALGEEAFVPNSRTHQTGVFALTKIQGQDQQGGLELGVRVDQVDVQASSTGSSPLVGPVAGAGVGNGPASARSFTPSSLSVGYSLPVGEQWLLGATVSGIQRAPSSFELYADGVHVATDAYEKGNPQLETERGRHVELSGVWQSGSQNPSKFTAKAFASAYSNYIALLGRTGADSTFNTLDEDGNPVSLQVFDFAAVPANFHGLELTWDTTWRLGSGVLRPSLQYEQLSGRRTDGGGNLPRIAPSRWIAKFPYQYQAWTFEPELIVVADSKASVSDPGVGAYHLVNLRVSRALSLGNWGVQVFGGVQNLGNALAFSATTVNTVRAYTPLAARNAYLGVKVLF